MSETISNSTTETTEATAERTPPTQMDLDESIVRAAETNGNQFGRLIVCDNSEVNAFMALYGMFSAENKIILGRVHANNLGDPTEVQSLASLLKSSEIPAGTKMLLVLGGSLTRMAESNNGHLDLSVLLPVIEMFDWAFIAGGENAIDPLRLPGSGTLPHPFLHASAAAAPPEEGQAENEADDDGGDEEEQSEEAVKRIDVSAGVRDKAPETTRKRVQLTVFQPHFVKLENLVGEVFTGDLDSLYAGIRKQTEPQVMHTLISKQSLLSALDEGRGDEAAFIKMLTSFPDGMLIDIASEDRATTVPAVTHATDVAAEAASES